jgi:hypothetical protein
MTTFWQDCKHAGGLALNALGEALAEANRAEQRERNRLHEARVQAEVATARATDRYADWDSEEGRALIHVFDAVSAHVRMNGNVIADNTPGDTFAVPLSANRNYRVVTALDDVRLIRTPAKPGKFKLYEDRMARYFGGRLENCYGTTLKISGLFSGLQIHAMSGSFGKAALLRFERGDTTDLHKLHAKLGL